MSFMPPAPTELLRHIERGSGLAVYRLEAWIQHIQPDMEDQLEELVISALKAQGIGVAHGPVVFRIYPQGEAGVPW